MRSSKREARDALLAPLAWGVLGAGACLLVAPFEPSLLEEGILLHIAQRIAHGEHLYRDVLAFTGPLPFQALALLFRVFGEEIWVGRGVVALLHGATAAAGFSIARRAGAGSLAHAAAATYAFAPLLLFPLLGIFYYTTLAFHLSVLSIWAALRGEQSRPWSFVAGIGVAAVALCKQPIGVGLALFTGLALALGVRGTRAQRFATLAAFAGGGVALAIATIGALLAAGTLSDALHALLVLPTSLGKTFDSPFPNLWPPGELSPAIAKTQAFYLPYLYILTQRIFERPDWRIILATQVLYATPIAALALTALRRLRGTLPSAVWLHTALLCTWLVNLYPRTDWGHLVHVLPSAVAQLCIVLPRPRAKRAARLAERAAVAVILLLLTGGSAWALWQIRQVAGQETLAPRVPLRPVSFGMRGPAVRRVIAFLSRHTEPGDPIFVARAEPLLYFATGTRNPTPYPGVIPGMHEEQTRVILEALRTVRYVVMSDVDQPAMTFYREELPAVQEQLERYFRIPDELLGGGVQWLVVLEPGPDRGATAIDLLELAGAARPFQRDLSGSIADGPPFTDRISTIYNRRPLGFELGARGGGLDFELTLPPGAVFQADVGLWFVNGRENLYRLPLGSLVRVSIGRDGEFSTVAETPVRTHEVDYRRWTPLEADLSAWSGQRVTLRIEFVTTQMPMKQDLGFVGSPRITLRTRDSGPGH